MNQESPSRIIYIDASALSGAWGAIARNAQVLQAGTTVYSMPASDKNAEYDRWAQEYDIHFIFDGHAPVPAFYAVPRLDIFAVDSAGGMIGTIGGCTDLQGDLPVAYVDSEGRVFRIAASGAEFMKKAPGWRAHMLPSDAVKLYASRAEACAELEFLELPQGACIPSIDTGT